MLAFLQYLLEKGLAFSTLKVYAAAVSAGHAGIDGVPVFSHPLVKRSLGGARRVRPAARVLTYILQSMVLTPRWDLPTVLRECEGLALVLYLMGHVLLDPLFFIEFSLTNHVE